MQLFQIVVNRDDSVQLASVDVVKETPQFYFITPKQRDLAWNDPKRTLRDAFGYSDRILKDCAFTSARAALTFYMARRQMDKANAKAVVAQATKQIASANELLMHLPAEETTDAALAKAEGR
jgi:hypothetical protein